MTELGSQPESVTVPVATRRVAAGVPGTEFVIARPHGGFSARLSQSQAPKQVERLKLDASSRVLEAVIMMTRAGANLNCRWRPGWPAGGPRVPRRQRSAGDSESESPPRRLCFGGERRLGPRAGRRPRPGLGLRRCDSPRARDDQVLCKHDTRTKLRVGR